MQEDDTIQTSDDQHERYLPQRVIVKFKERFDRYEDGAEQYFPDEEKQAWEALQEHYPGILVERLYRSVDVGTIEWLVQDAEEKDPDYEAPDFLTYYVVTLPGDNADYSPIELGEELVDLFGGWNIIEDVYIEARPAPLPGPGWPNPCAQPPHHGATPISVDVLIARNSPGGRGEGSRLVDLERVWDLSHPDLNQGQPLMAGVGIPDVGAYTDMGLMPADFQASIRHSTAVLGILAAQGVADGTGCIGIAPGADVSIASSLRTNATGTWGENIADALIDVNAQLQAGDVVLVELQVYADNNRFAPVELKQHIWDQVRLMTARQIIVIEAAGNSGVNLNVLTVSTIRPRFLDEHSGAILVSACQRPPVSSLTSSAPPPLQRFASSNFGLRIDCCAWGQSIMTLQAGNNANFGLFGNTSGAAAIIAGVALLIQGIVWANLGRRLNVSGMHRMLTMGTAAANIGVMPDLKVIIQTIQNNQIQTTELI